MRHDQDHFGWKSFKALSPKKKLQHILYYYKWHFLAAVLVLCLLFSLISDVRENAKDVLISGIFVNTAVDQSGYDYLQQGYWESCDSDSGSRADLVTYRHIDTGTGALDQEDAASFMVITSMIAAGTLDYIITDEATLEYFLQQEVVLDLKDVFLEEALSKYDVIEADGTAAAIRLNNSDFAQKYPLTEEDSCLLLAVSTQDYEKDIRFIQYVMGY